MNRIIEIKVSLLLVSLAGIAILSSFLTAVIVTRPTESAHIACPNTPIKLQKQKAKAAPNSWWVPSNDGRKF